MYANHGIHIAAELHCIEYSKRSLQRIVIKMPAQFVIRCCCRLNLVGNTLDRCSPEVKSASFESAGTHVSFQTEMIETASTQVSDAEEDTLETNNEHEHPDSEMQHDGMHDSVLTASPPYIETNTRKATVNEQMIAGALTGQKTNVDANSKQILTEREAQAVLAQYRRVNNQITGDVKREGADVSYYNDEGKRFAEPEGILQYQYDYESEFLEEVKDLPFYHGTSETTQAITVLLHRSGEGSYLLRSVDGKVCLSYQTKLLVSHHTFRKGEDGSMEVDGSPFHAAGFIRFPSCTTITQVSRRLRSTRVAAAEWQFPVFS